MTIDTAKMLAMSEQTDELLRSIRINLGLPDRREETVDEIRARTAELRAENDAAMAGRRRRTTLKLVTGGAA